MDSSEILKMADQLSRNKAVWFTLDLVVRPRLSTQLKKDYDKLERGFRGSKKEKVGKAVLEAYTSGLFREIELEMKNQKYREKRAFRADIEKWLVKRSNGVLDRRTASYIRRILEGVFDAAFSPKEERKRIIARKVSGVILSELNYSSKNLLNEYIEEFGAWTSKRTAGKVAAQELRQITSTAEYFYKNGLNTDSVLDLLKPYINEMGKEVKAQELKFIGQISARATKGRIGEAQIIKFDKNLNHLFDYEGRLRPGGMFIVVKKSIAGHLSPVNRRRFKRLWRALRLDENSARLQRELISYTNGVSSFIGKSAKEVINSDEFKVLDNSAKASFIRDHLGEGVRNAHASNARLTQDFMKELSKRDLSEVEFKRLVDERFKDSEIVKAVMAEKAREAEALELRKRLDKVKKPKAVSVKDKEIIKLLNDGLLKDGFSPEELSQKLNISARRIEKLVVSTDALGVKRQLVNDEIMKKVKIFALEKSPLRPYTEAELKNIRSLTNDIDALRSHFRTKTVSKKGREYWKYTEMPFDTQEELKEMLSSLKALRRIRQDERESELLELLDTEAKFFNVNFDDDDYSTVGDKYKKQLDELNSFEREVNLINVSDELDLDDIDFLDEVVIPTDLDLDEIDIDLSGIDELDDLDLILNDNLTDIAKDKVDELVDDLSELAELDLDDELAIELLDEGLVPFPEERFNKVNKIIIGEVLDENYEEAAEFAEGAYSQIASHGQRAQLVKFSIDLGKSLGGSPVARRHAVGSKPCKQCSDADGLEVPVDSDGIARVMKFHDNCRCEVTVDFIKRETAYDSVPKWQKDVNDFYESFDDEGIDAFDTDLVF